MSYDIHQSAGSYPLLFFMVSSTDHISPATGLSPTVTISKNGGSFATPSGAVSEIANGWYKVAGNASDTGTLGPLALHASATGADNCDMIVCNIVSFNPFATDMGLTPPSEAYAAKGSVGTFSTILQALRCMESSAWAAGTPTSTQGTLTGYKLDGVTAAKTWVGNDPVNPTQLIETT